MSKYKYPWGYNGGVCRPAIETVYDGSLTLFEKMCKLVSIVLGLEDQVEAFEGQLDAKEDSDNITGNRKLSELGSFTGDLCGKKTACQVPDEIDNNRDQIQYLVSQFSDGQTGLVIDGGFFEETGIKKNYNGGVF